MSQGHDPIQIMKMTPREIAAEMDGISNARIRASNQVRKLAKALKELVEAADEFEGNHVSCGGRKGAKNNRLLDAIIAAHQAMETPL